MLPLLLLTCSIALASQIAVFRFGPNGDVQVLLHESSRTNELSLPTNEGELKDKIAFDSCSTIKSREMKFKACRSNMEYDGFLKMTVKIGGTTYRWVSEQSDALSEIFEKANQKNLQEYLDDHGLNKKTGPSKKGRFYLMAVQTGTNRFIDLNLDSRIRKKLDRAESWTETLDKDKSFKKKFETIYDLVKLDTVTAATVELVRDPDSNVLIVSFANNYRPGGGYKIGCTAQEEDIFRRTTLAHFLDTDYSRKHFYPINDLNEEEETNAIYSKSVNILRASERNGFGFYSDREIESYAINVCSVAALNKRSKSEAKYFNAEGGFTKAGRRITKDRIRTMFYVAAGTKANVLIIGAFGCGAFQNKPEEMVQLFNQVMKEYDGVVRKVLFAIVGKKNYGVFEEGLSFLQ